MTQFDLAGEWDYLGTVTPKYEEWTRFPISTQSFSPVIRVTFYDDYSYSRITTFGYLKVVFVLPQNFETRWYRIYPSTTPLILSFPIPNELLLTSQIVVRHFEVMKRHKSRNPNVRSNDSQWSCSIENLQLINLTNESQILLDQVDTLRQVATIIQEQISEGD